MMVLFCGLAALVVDLGLARDLQRQAQNAADTAALGAAQYLAGTPNPTPAQITQAQQTANAYISANGWKAGASSVLVDGTAHTVTVQLTPVQSPTIFAGVIGQSAPQVAGRAQAAFPGGGPVTCALCLLKMTGTTLSATGAGSMTINGGGIAVNSSDPKAASITNPAGGGFTVSPAPPNTISIAGGYQQAAAGQFSPTPTTGAAPVPDPLASLPVPLPCTAPGALPAPDCVLGNETSVNLSGSTDMTLSPGVYSSIKSSSTGTLTMQPGIYVITSTLTLNKSPAPGKTSLVAPGVLLYFACSAYPTPCAAAGTSGADFSMTGGATASISSPTSGSWQGVNIFFDRTNTNTLTLTGSSASSFSGSIYLKSGGTTLTGISGVFTLNSLIVTSTLTRTGNSSIGISFDPAYNYPGLNGNGSVHLTE